MAVVSVQERFGSGVRFSEQEADGNRRHTRSFHVAVDDATDNGATILTSGQCPPRYSLHPDDAGALLLGRRVNEGDSPFQWILTCEYNTKITQAQAQTAGGIPTGDGAPQEVDENPLNRSPEIEYSVVRYQWALERDVADEPIRNKAREKFNPPPVQDRAHLALSIQRNIQQFNPNLIASHVYAVNQGNFLGFAQDEVLLDDLKVKPRWEGGHFFWDVSARFVFYPINSITVPNQPPIVIGGGWLYRPLNAGFMELNGGAQRRIVLPGGGFPSEPVLLTNAGAKAANNADPIYLEFRIHDRKNFADLGII